METQIKKSAADAKKTEAEARLAEISTINAEIELLQKLKDLGIALHRDSNGNLTALPAPPELDLLQVLEQKQIAKPFIPEGVNVESDGVHLRGAVRGHISFPTKTMIVEPEAEVHGQLHADVIIIASSAAVYGNIFGSSHVQIRARGKLVGDIRTARVSIEEEAEFNGKVELLQ